MAADPTGAGCAGGLDGDEPGRNRVVALSGRRVPVVPGRTAADVREGASAAILRFGLHFTAADRAVLAAWASDPGHGYDRLRVEVGVLEDGDLASYALVYVPGQAWSAWGLTRRDNQVEVWRCATGQTVGRHAHMADALTSLPHATDHQRAPSTDAGRARARMGSRQPRPR